MKTGKIKQLQWLLCILSIAIGGCNDASDADTDTGLDTASDADADADTDADSDGDAVSQPTPDGRILVATSGWGGQFNPEAYITIDFFDGPMRMDAFSAYTPGLHRVAVQEGDCVLYTTSDAACSPLCDWDQYCNFDNSCVTAPSRISAGRVTLTAGTTTITADASTDDWSPGFYYADPIPANLVNAETDFTASAAGDAFPAFSLRTPGLLPLEFSIDAQNSALVLEDGRDNEITWDAASAVAQSTVQLVINHGWHGSPPEAVLYCETAAAEGVMVIPQAVVEATPVIGGIALMQHGSFIAATRTVNEVVSGYTVEFSVSQRAGLNVEHNAPSM